MKKKINDNLIICIKIKCSCTNNRVATLWIKKKILLLSQTLKIEVGN